MRPPAVPRVAAEQHGVFTRGQARTEGWTDRQVRRRVEVGAWIVVAGIGLASRDLVVGPWQLGSAACLTWPGAVVSHRLAGALWGLPNCHCDIATVTVGPQQVLRGRQLRARRSELPSCDITRLSGLLVTTRDRTAVDLLALLPWDDARNLWAWLVSRRILDLAGLTRATAQRTYLGGTPQLRRLIDIGAAGSLSAAEDLFHDLLRAAGIAGWTANAEIHVDGRVVAVADVLFEDAKVIVEIDGWVAHSDRGAFQRDRTRQNHLVAEGFVVLRFTWEDLTERRAYVLATLRRALRIS